LLEGHGDYVEFTLSAPANALTVRYAVPDGPEGKPVDARLGVYAQNRRIGGVGLYGHDAPNPSQAVDIHDLAIIGQVNERDDHKALAGIGGAMGGGSLIRNVFIQHVKVGLWLDGPFDGLIVRHVRVLDTTADGLNLHRGISHVIVEESFFRNNGDDGIASWAEKLANHDIIIRHNTVVAPILANGVAIYGRARRQYRSPPAYWHRRRLVICIGYADQGADRSANDHLVGQQPGSGAAVRQAHRWIGRECIVEPSARRCKDFQLEWKGSNNGLTRSSAQGC
jgi:hypothetical protein